MSLFKELRALAEPKYQVRIPQVDPWEAAYLRFETPEEEIEKFTARLIRFGITSWPRNIRIIELFCGRGNGLHALERVGFNNIEGVDLSPRLVEKYSGKAKCYVADCRHLPFADGSKDSAIVQGGLHHLLQLPEDLDQVFSEIRRVLTKDGFVLFVEPWLTPFLKAVHGLTRIQMLRKLSRKLDALSIMIEHEKSSYFQWLEQPEQIKALAHKHFVPLRESASWGKWNFVGKRRSESAS
jgi:SAM-dependent methyltransferase